MLALNQRGDFQANGRPWTEGTIRRMLTSECYIGNIVWGKQAGKLGRSRRKVDRSNWVRQEAAFPAVVDPSVFWRVQAEIARRKSRFSEEEIITGLQKLLKKHRTLNKPLIDKAAGVPSTTAIVRCFGSLVAAYERVGFHSTPSNKSIKTNAQVAALTHKLGQAFSKKLGLAKVEQAGPVYRIEQDGVYVVLLLARYIDRMVSVERWNIQWDSLNQATVAVIGLMDPQNIRVKSYHVVPCLELSNLRLRKHRDDGQCLQNFHQPNLTACISEVISQMNARDITTAQGNPFTS